MDSMCFPSFWRINVIFPCKNDFTRVAILGVQVSLNNYVSLIYHCCHFSLQQNYPDSCASTENKRPSIVEKADDPNKYFHVPPASNTCRNLLLPNLGSPVRRTSLGNLLGEELLQFNALRHCRSPVRGWSPKPSPKPQTKVQKQTHPPSSTPKPTHKTQTDSEGIGCKPAKLLIPTLNCFGPPDLSPR